MREMGEGYALLSLGMTFAVAVAGAALLGLWLDRRLGTLPLFTVVGSLLGMAAAGFWLYQRLIGFERKDGGDGH